jgi:predicted protein tyrosine phosphatase
MSKYKAIAISKRIFESNFDNDKIEKQKGYTLFISILDMDNEEKKYKDLPNFLQVKMWDIEEDLHDKNGLKYLKPSDTELQKIVDFVNNNQNYKRCIVHCSAGISRSGAVVTWLKAKFKIDNQSFLDTNKFIQPNLYILNRLKQLDYEN